MDRFAGGCLCGDVRFVAAGRPYRVGLCHCLDCRKHHGALFYAGAVALILQGSRDGARATGVIGIAAFIVPFIFFYNAPMLMQGSWFEVAHVFVTATIGIYLLASGVQGWLFGRLGWPLRIISSYLSETSSGDWIRRRAGRPALWPGCRSKRARPSSVSP